MSTVSDHKAPVPYIRRAKFEAKETKFMYDQFAINMKTVKTNEGTKEELETKETTTYTREKKVKLTTYGHTSEEDAEHFFEAFEKLKKELGEEWKNASESKDSSAQVLFEATDKMLIGTANAEWQNILKEDPDMEFSKSWEMFKTRMATFICKVILSDDAINQQLSYLRERMKPADLTVKEWYLRLQTLRRYLIYFVKDMKTLKQHCGSDCNFKDWWKKEILGDHDVRMIVTTRVPLSWQNQLKLQDFGHKYRDEGSISSIIDYFTLIENQERTQHRLRDRGLAARLTPRGRGIPARGGRQAYELRNHRRQQGTTNPNRGIDYRQRRPMMNSYRSNNYHGNANRQSHNRYQPPRYHNQGGRAGSLMRGNGVNGQFGGQRSGRGQFQGRGNFNNSSNGGQNQQIQVRRPDGFYQERRRRNEAFYQDQLETVDEAEDDEWQDDQFYIDDTDEQNYHGGNSQEDELLDTWNENFYLYDEEEEYQEEENYQLMDNSYHYDRDQAYDGYGRWHG